MGLSVIKRGQFRELHSCTSMWSLRCSCGVVLEGSPEVMLKTHTHTILSCHDLEKDYFIISQR